MNTPQISIALCTYNGERFLREQLDSLLAQDYPKLDIVAVDDASSDGTAAILEDYARRDGRLRVQRNAANVGFARNFSLALSLCSGDWIAPCDQDDLWLPQKLSRLMQASGGADLVYCDSELVDENGRSLGRTVSDNFNFYEGNDPRAFTFINCISGHAMLFRRSLLQRALPVPAGVYHDWWLAFAAANGGGIACLKQPLVRFRQHGANASNFSGSVAKTKKSLVEKFEKETQALRALASYAGPQQAFFQELLQLWQQKRGKSYSWPLAAFLHRYRDAVFAIRKTPPVLRFKHIPKLARGVPVGVSA